MIRTRRQSILSVFVGILMLSGGYGMAAVTDFSEGFDNGTTEGWKRVDALNGGNLYMVNVDGALKIDFPKQQTSFPQMSWIQGDINASGGAFAGDYISAGITGITFRLMYETLPATQARLYLHSGSRDWYVELAPGNAGEWTTYTVPLEHAAGWTTPVGGSAVTFAEDLADVVRLSLRLQRNGSTARHSYYLDDMAIPGIPPYKVVSGNVGYTGDASGNILVLSVADSASWDLSTSDAAEWDGSFALQVSNRTNQYVKAFMDMDGNGVLGAWEPYGAWLGNPSEVGSGDQSGAFIALNDPMSEYGIPWWWLKQYFGMTPAARSAIPGSFGALDSDGDGANNWEEYKALTDPTDELSVFKVGLGDSAGNQIFWPSANGRTYKVLRSDSLFGTFTIIADDITATPPANVYTDVPAEAGSYFYKVVVED